MAHILVIERDDLVRLLVARTLQRQAYTTESASTFEHWVAQRDRHLPDLIVTDIGRPGPASWTLLRQLRSHPATAQIPILAMSAVSGPGDAELACEVGAIGLVLKPFEPRRFLDDVASALGQLLA